MYFRFSVSYEIVQTVQSTRNVTVKIGSQLQIYNRLCIDFLSNMTWLLTESFETKTWPAAFLLPYPWPCWFTAALLVQHSLSDFSLIQLIQLTPRQEAFLHHCSFSMKNQHGLNRAATTSSSSEKPTDDQEEEVPLSGRWVMTNVAFHQNRVLHLHLT